MKRATVYIVLLGVVCTALGVAIGVGIEKRYTERNLPRIVRGQLLKHPRIAQQLGRRAILAQVAKRRAVGANIFKRIGRELDLSSEQKGKVQSILQETRQQVTQARDGFKAQVEQVKEKSNAQILEVLDPEQKEKFLELTVRVKKIKEKRGIGERRRFRELE